MWPCRFFDSLKTFRKALCRIGFSGMSLPQVGGGKEAVNGFGESETGEESK